MAVKVQAEKGISIFVFFFPFLMCSKVQNYLSSKVHRNHVKLLIARGGNLDPFTYEWFFCSCYDVSLMDQTGKNNLAKNEMGQMGSQSIFLMHKTS